MAEENFTVRILQIGDYDEVFRLWTGSAGMRIRALDDSPEGVKKFLERNPHTCFVAEAPASGGGERKIAGVILSGYDGRRAHIYHTAVNETFRGRGVGRALVAAVEKAAREKGISKIVLVALKDNEKGNRFWEKMGYTERKDLIYRDKSFNQENE
jgi:ribosomal protein S18 acetylase RimI-like enzyme